MLPEVSRWFAQRTSHADDWRAEDLLGRGSVAVVIPALDEERTVGAIVEALRRDLVDRVPLVTELVVVDSGSRDRTAAIAEAAGARVVHREDVLGHLPALPGKGEVLWRGVAATTSEVVAFVDSDLEDFTSAFVTGLVGPLLTDPAVSFVKATFDRPLAAGEVVLPAGGGRVTELVARPLINLHWPQLAGFVQPLGGEYAARRALLESLSFPVGYGVELGLLVDAWRAVGLAGMAQVDLVSRKHRHQGDAKLGRMAAEIWQVAQRRLGHEVGQPASLTQFERRADGSYEVVVSDVTEQERPPLAGLAR